MSVLP